MWLPKSERNLLRRYYCDIGTIDETKVYNDTISLMEEIGYRKEKPEKIANKDKHGKTHGDWILEFDATNNILAKRGLIVCKHDGIMHDPIIELTKEGYDLGMRYNGWFYKTGGMWWSEYTGHWIWSILTAIVTFIIGFVIGILT